MIKFRWRAKLSFLLSGIKSALRRRKIFVSIILMSLIFYSVIPSIILSLFSMMILLLSFQVSINLLTNRLFSSSFIGDVYYCYNSEKEKAIRKIRRAAIEKKDSKKDSIEREAVIKISEIFDETGNMPDSNIEEAIETVDEIIMNKNSISRKSYQNS